MTTIADPPIVKTPRRTSPAFLVDTRQERPLGWEKATCTKCRAQLCFWQQHGPAIELNCYGCGRHLAVWAGSYATTPLPTP